MNYRWTMYLFPDGGGVLRTVSFVKEDVDPKLVLPAIFFFDFCKTFFFFFYIFSTFPCICVKFKPHMTLNNKNLLGGGKPTNLCGDFYNKIINISIFTIPLG